jgi:NADPH-dependent ferric siderophore reductase
VSLHDPAAAHTYLLTVAGTADLNPRMRRITLTADTLADFDPWPGQDVVLHLTDERGSGVRRRYTVRHLDRAKRTFDLDFVLHGHGPGARWAERARPGEQIEVFGPRGKVALAGARWQLFAGDESALPGIAEMVEALPRDVSVTAFLEVQDADDEQRIDAAADLDLRWLHRGTTAAGTADVLDRALDGVSLPSSDRHVYLFGESRAVRRLRDIMRRRGVTPEEISAKGYWNLGRALAG